MNWAQYSILALQLIGLFLQLKHDCEGRAAKDPTGFKGVTITLLITTGIFLLYWKAGFFRPN